MLDSLRRVYHGFRNISTVHTTMKLLEIYDSHLFITLLFSSLNCNLQVEFTSTKRTQEKRRDIGLITIKTHKESRPYTVKAVIDAATDKHLSIDEAISKGILDQAKGNYHNTLTGRFSKASSALWLCRFVIFFVKSL